MAIDGLTIINGLNTVFEFLKGTIWTEIPFTGDVAASGGEAPSSEVVTFRRVGSVVGHERVPSLTVQVPSYIPHHSTWRALSVAKKASTLVQFRLRTREEEIADSDAETAAITTTGAVTLNPLVTAGHVVDWRGEGYGIGLGMKIGNNILTVDTISEAGMLTVDPAPSAAIAAASYKVVRPSLRLGPFLCRITTLSSFNLPTEGQLGTTLGLQPVVQLPDWVVHS